MINRRFIIKKKLGQGRSAVYLCEDLEQAGKNVALKILHAYSSEEEKKAFKDEFQMLQKLDHPSIIQAYERGTILEVTETEPISIGSKYLAMEYFDGKELLDYLIKNESSLKEIIAQICSVLFYLHQSNYIYYDLKLENILVNEINGKPVLKLIDLGFARSHINQTDDVITGTAEYLAPEILKKEPHDHRIDLYSFGILLYHLIYEKFPFDSKDQLEIYKEQIEKEFYFPETKYSAELINVVKKLLRKNPEERYFTSIQILYDLNIQITEQLFRDWVPIQVFSDRTDILNVVNRYVSTPPSGEVIIIRGFERAGKTAVSREIYSRYENVVQLPNDRTKSGFPLIKFFLNKLIYNELIFEKLSSDTIDLVNKIINNQSEDLTNDLKLVVNKITSLNRFILLLDDFNLYDSFSLEVFKEIFPVFQVNGCNIILTEKSDLDYVTGFINNSVHLDLTSFTTVQIDELLEKTYAGFFPINDVRQLIMKHADFLPGNVMEFLRDLVLLKIIRFDYDGIKVVSDESSETILVNLYEEVYNIRFKSLNEDELKISSILSSFENIPDNKILVQLTGCSEEKFSGIIEDLKRKHILQSQSQAGLNFSSDGLKNFVYSQIPNKRKHHENIAETIKQYFPQFSKVELARQYQICERYDNSFLLLMREVEDAEKISALKYSRSILEQILKLPLKPKQIFDVKLKLSSLYDTLNDFQQTYSTASDLLKENLADQVKSDLLLMQGNALIRIGEIQKGMDILKSLLPIIKDDKKKLKLMLNIAGAELDANNFESASLMCHDIIKNPSASYEILGDAYNLLGIVLFHFKNDIDSALDYFKQCLNSYKTASSLQRVAAAEINIGNIFNIRGNYDDAEKHWNHSLEITQSTGNLYQQGKVSLNLGGFYFHNLNLDKSVENYNKAKIIFNSLGDQADYGLTETNLGEIYLFLCEYQTAIAYLNSARDVFHKIQNYIEEAEVLFLIGKVNYKMGNYKFLAENITELINISELIDNPARINLHISFLTSFHEIGIQKKADDHNLKKIAEEYLKQEERINYFEAIILQAKYFLHAGESKKALDLLLDVNFTNVSKTNAYLEAEKLFLTGMIANSSSEFDLKNPAFYFQEALKKIEDLHVTELTWQIFFEMTTYYANRGNLSKAKEYAHYGRSLLNYFGEKFNDERIKEFFFSSAHRKIAWEKFTEIINFD